MGGSAKGCWRSGCGSEITGMMPLTSPTERNIAMERDELEKRLNSIAMAGRDIEEAISYLREIKRRGLDFHYYNPHQDRADIILFEPLILALTVSYRRIFGLNHDRDGKKTINISDSCVPKKYKPLHDALITLRDTEHAHSDMDAMGFSHSAEFFDDENLAEFCENLPTLPYSTCRVPPLDPWKNNWKDEVGFLLKEVRSKIVEKGKVLWEKKKEEDLKLQRKIHEAERRFYGP